MKQGAPAGVAETHGAIVLFVGDRAYKVKKPVRFAFFDFSTAEKRRAVLWRELHLNRRLAPDTYLRVLDVVDDEGRLVDAILEMRRMPEDRRLSTLAEEGADVDDCLREIARTVTAFHARAETSPEIASIATRDSLAGLWDENSEEMSPFVGHDDSILDEVTFERMNSLAKRYLSGRERLFGERIEGGHVRDGHGDLLATDIFCLDDGPRILDCIEFDDRFRWGDVIADAAFLAMDLERIGRPDLARCFLDYYREFSGEHYPDSLVHYHVAHRAQIRSKVACLRAAQGEATQRAQACLLLDMAVRHLESACPRLVLVGGLPGTGKTTVATAISDAYGWALLRSDVVRDELFADAPGVEAGAETRYAEGDREGEVTGYGRGRYAPEAKAAVYEELLRQADTVLRSGVSVVLDASWTSQVAREAARLVAADAHAYLYEVRCVAPPEVAAARIRARLGEGTDASEATPDVASQMGSDADPWPEATVLGTTGAPPEVTAEALELLGQEGVPEIDVR